MRSKRFSRTLSATGRLRRNAERALRVNLSLCDSFDTLLRVKGVEFKRLRLYI